METDLLIRQLAGIVSGGAPLVLAAIGETFTERAGVVNLALDGSLMLSAMAGFVAGLATGSVFMGALVGMLVGLLVALLVAFSSIQLKQSQVAVGFILTLFCRDLAIFLGQPYRSLAGLSVPNLPIPILRDIPVLGPIFFNHDAFTYLSLLAIFAAWFWIFRTRPGLTLRTIGERPATAFARGTNVNRARYLYTALGGALVGLGGAAYTLRATWLESAVLGNGWIALAIVIFGGWYPLRVAFGVYLVAALRAVVTGVQGTGQINQQLVELMNALPWLLMIGTLFVVSGPYLDRLLKVLPPRLHPLIRTVLRARPPAALGTSFEQEGRR